MQILSTVNIIKEKLLKELPTEVAHQEIAPYRKSNDFNKDQLNSSRNSGVLVLLMENTSSNTLEIPLIKRVEYPGVHSGQISFPGGKREEQDRTIIDTALREAEEEVNIDPNTVKVIGELSQVFIPPSKSLVTPIVAYTENDQNFIPEEKEVDRILFLNLKNLLENSALVNRKIKLSTGMNINVPAFDLEGEVVWGATAMMLNELRHLLIR